MKYRIRIYARLLDVPRNEPSSGRRAGSCSLPFRTLSAGDADLPPGMPVTDDTLSELPGGDWGGPMASSSCAGKATPGARVPYASYFYAASISGVKYVRAASLESIDNANMTCTYDVLFNEQTLGQPIVESHGTATVPWRPYQICDGTPSVGSRDARSPVITVGDRPYFSWSTPENWSSTTWG